MNNTANRLLRSLPFQSGINNSFSSSSTPSALKKSLSFAGKSVLVLGGGITTFIGGRILLIRHLSSSDEKFLNDIIPTIIEIFFDRDLLIKDGTVPRVNGHLLGSKALIPPGEPRIKLFRTILEEGAEKIRAEEFSRSANTGSFELTSSPELKTKISHSSLRITNISYIMERVKEEMAKEKSNLK